MQNKRKITTAIVASVVAVALLLGGTFAWQSINQTALNEASDVINPGGRLHDDFDGSNKDVYVENFADEPIFARIQLSEYFAIIANYGKEGAQTKTDIVGSATLEDGKIVNPTYVPYKFDGNVNEDGTFKAAVDAEGNPYWNWATGGSTVFMPTFNLNKDSLVADINGTYRDAIGGISNRDGNQYTDYTKYEVGDTEEGTEIYDGDTNTADEVKDDFDNLDTYVQAGNIVTVDATHTAKATGTATLISMSEWLAKIEENGGVYDADAHGNYWVYDTDGWVYWSAPIAPDTATGLLLDGIALNGVMDDTWYYAINVVAQFVTADDVGKNDGTGFYDEANGTAPSADAASLLDLIGVEMNEVIKLNGEQTTVVNPNNTYTMSVGVATTYAMRSASTYTFTLAEGAPAEITITDSTLNVGAAEEGTQFTVIATPDSGETVETTFTVAIKELLIARGDNEGEITAAVGEPVRPVPYEDKVDLSTIYVYYEEPNLTLTLVADTSYTYEDGILTITDSELAGKKLGVFPASRTYAGWINLTAAATEEPVYDDATLAIINEIATAELVGSVASGGTGADIYNNNKNLQKVTIDGEQYFVVVRDESTPGAERALLLKYDSHSFYTPEGSNYAIYTKYGDSTKWADSDVYALLNSTESVTIKTGNYYATNLDSGYELTVVPFLTENTTVAQIAIPTEISTRVYDDQGGYTYETTTCKVFTMSEADVNGTIGGVATSNTEDYTYVLNDQGVDLFEYALGGQYSGGSYASYCYGWLRSVYSTETVGYMMFDGSVVGNYPQGGYEEWESDDCTYYTYGYVYPMFWADISAADVYNG